MVVVFIIENNKAPQRSSEIKNKKSDDKMCNTRGGWFSQFLYILSHCRDREWCPQANQYAISGIN